MTDRSANDILAPRIEQVAGPGLTDDLDCNVYAIVGTDRTILVDSGAGRVMLQPPKHAEAVLLTHLHCDHSGGAAALAAQGLRIYAHEWTAEALRTGDDERASLPAAKKIGIYPDDYTFAVCPTVETLPAQMQWNLGECTVSSAETPGHSEGHLSFIIDLPNRRAVISGDLIFAGG